MKKIVISGSAKLQKKVKYWKDYFEKNNYIVTDYPRNINENEFMQLYPNIHIDFFNNIIESDIFFLMNEDKNKISGYIGSESFAELTFALFQNLIYKKNIKIFILKMPSKKVHCYDEIYLWKKLGWIDIYKEEKNEY